MRAVLLSLLLLAARAAAQEAWKGPLDPNDLRSMRDDAAARRDAATDEALRKAYGDRVGLLETLVQTLEERGRFLTLDAIARREADAQGKLEALRAQPVDAGPLGVTTKDGLDAYEQQVRTADADAKAAQTALDDLTGREKRVREESAAFPSRTADLARRLDAEPEGGELGNLTADNLQLEQRLLAERAEFARLALERWSKRIPMMQVERDLARLRLERARAMFARASEEFSKEQERKAKAEQERAAQAEAAARQAQDPLERARQELLAETSRTNSARTADEGQMPRLQRRIDEERESLTRLQQEAQRLRERFEAGGGGGSERMGRILQNTRKRIAQAREKLGGRTLPDLYREIEANQTTRLKMLDRLWELDAPVEETQLFERLVDTVGASREQEVRAAYESLVTGPDGLVAALRARVAVLGAIEANLGIVEGLLLERQAVLEETASRILRRIYWVQTMPPVTPQVFLDAGRDATDLVRTYASLALHADLANRLGRSPVKSGLVVAGLVLLTVAAWFASRRIGASGRRWKYRGGAILAGLQRTLVALVLSAVIPALALAAAALLRLLPLPALYAEPVPRVLQAFAGIWFVRQLAFRLLRPEGVAVVEWGMPGSVAGQLLRSVRLATTAGLLFLLPQSLLDGSPFDPAAFTELQRLLNLGFLAAMAFALILLLRRRGAVVQEWTRHSTMLSRIWRLLGPLLTLGLAGVVAMDALGFHDGAREMMRNATATFLAVVLLTGIYRLLRKVVDRLASRVLREALKEAGREDAWEQSATVRSQLTRVVTVVILVCALVLLTGFWDLDERVSGLLDGVQITSVGDGADLTLWDIGIALLWIVAAHFFLANISGVYEFLVFPLLGSTDQGGRYVLLALSRYAVLLVAYSAALLSLHFSFQSIGWLLAAASVGLGFGLQEIVANFVSGLILLLERPIRVGDIITVGTTGGMVEKINIRATVVTNWDRQQIIVPNKVFVTENLTNWTRNDQLMRRKVQVGVSYGSDVATVLRILKEVVEQHPKIRHDPPPRYFFQGFGESSLDFEFWFFTDIADGLPTMSDLRTAILQRFREAQVEIPFPQRDLHLRSVADADIAAALLERRRETPAAE